MGFDMCAVIAIKVRKWSILVYINLLPMFWVCVKREPTGVWCLIRSTSSDCFASFYSNVASSLCLEDCDLLNHQGKCCGLLPGCVVFLLAILESLCRTIFSLFGMLGHIHWRLLSFDLHVVCHIVVFFLVL